MNKLVRVSTVPISLNFLLQGQLKYLNQYYHIIGISSDGNDLEVVKQREGIEVYAINMERHVDLLKDFVGLCKLYIYLRKEKPEIVHSITPKAGLLTMIAAKLAGIPIRIHTFTGLIFPSKTGLFQKILIAMDRLLCSCATNVLAEGKGVLNDLTRFRITSKPLKVLANGNINGINTSFFNPELYSEDQKKELRSSLGIGLDDFVFVFVGRLVGDKGINELIVAFCELNLQYPKIRLLLVGPFESDLDPLKDETIEMLNSNVNIIQVGFQSDVRPYFAISNALVFPSYREGFPNVVLQAGAMGLPSIVTDINGCNEIIVDDVNGMIIPVKNVQILKDTMELFITDSILCSRLKCNSREMICSRFEQKVVWEALLAEYRQLEQASLI